MAGLRVRRKVPMPTTLGLTAAMVRGSGRADVRAEPAASSALRWRAEPGVVGKLKGCRVDWCEVDIGGRKGWIARERLWGAEDLPGDE